MSENSPRKIMIACGGTGGHFYPGLTIAGAACEVGAEVSLALSGKNLEQFSAVAKRAKIPVFCQTELRRPTEKWKLPLLALYILRDIWKSLKLLRKERPDAVVGMGSFASFSFCFAAALTKTPLYLHEGNAVVGKSNCMLSRWARKIFLSFKPLNGARLQCGFSVEGFPVRKDLIVAAECPLSVFEKSQIYGAMGLEPARKTLLVFGGSQGAMAINQVVSEALCNSFQGALFQVIHIVGANCDESAIKQSYQESGIKSVVLSYMKDMGQCYQIADFAICRAGASSIYELARFSVPVVLVPLPTAADDHQTANARRVEEQGGAILVPQHLFNGAHFCKVVGDWLADDGVFLEMGKRMNGCFGQGNPASEFIDYVLDDLG